MTHLIPSDPRDYYKGSAWSPVWAFVFGPMYYLWWGHWREFLIVLILMPFVVGTLLSPFLARGAWERKAQDLADKNNLAMLVEELGRRIS